MCVRCQGSIIITLEQQLQLQKKASVVEVAAKLREELTQAQSKMVEMGEQMEAVREKLLASQAEVAEAQSHFLDGRGQLAESEAEVARLESGFDALAFRLSEANTQLTRERQLRLEHEAAWPAAAREQMAAEVEAARAEATAARAEAAAARGQMQVMAEVEAAMATAAAATETAREQMVAEVEAAQVEAVAEAVAAREETAVATAAAAAATAEMQAAEGEAKAAREIAATAAAVVDQATWKMQAAQAEVGAARQGRGAVMAIKVPPEAAVAAAAAAETEGVHAGVRAELTRVRMELVAGAEAARAETAAARAEVAAVQAQMAVGLAALHTHLHGGQGSQERGALSRRSASHSRPKWKPPGASPERPAQAMRAPLQPHLRVHGSPRNKNAAPSYMESRSTPRLERPTYWAASPPRTPRAGKATNAAAWRVEEAEEAAQSQPGPVARGLMAEGFMGWTGAGQGHSGQWRLDVSPPAAVASMPGVQSGDDLALARTQLAETRAQMHQILSYMPGCFPLSGSEPGV
jgi:chemotaxis protein histidine kinase CheA